MTSKSERMRARGGVRSYVLALRPNHGKAEDARHAIWWSQRWCQDYVEQLYDEKPNATVSTAGKGWLNNSAQKTARDILRAGRAAEKATGEVFERPKTTPQYAIATLKPARHSKHFDFWATIPTLAPIPLQAHKAFSRALRAGGKITTQCQVRLGKNGGMVARVCVEMPHKEPTPSRDYLGCDVGVNAAVACSDGYVARSLRPVMLRTREKRAEQQRQGHHRTSARSAVKQRLDHEARRAVTLAARTGRTLVIESQKALGNLSPRGSIGGWARRHFGERVLQIGGTLGVTVKQEWPSYTSQACRKCNAVNPNNRRGVEFRCLTCGHEEHADVLAARNLVRKARGVFPKVERRKGHGKDMVVSSGSSPSLVGVLS